jgi:quercetin dioxygenase-like cupin family protein
MRRLVMSSCAVLAIGGAGARTVTGQATPPTASPASKIQYDSAVATREAGPHNGGGETTAYSFFKNEPAFALVFRKRALHPGSAIGYHRNAEDEVYYVLSGRGELTLDGARREVRPGTAILTRAGSSHGLRQLGGEDLVILISYQQTIR